MPTLLSVMCSFLLLNADEVCFCDFVCGPADGRAGSSGQDSCVHAAEEALGALPPVNDAGGVEQSPGVADLGVGVGAPRLQKSLYDIERSGCGGCDTSGKTTGGAVSERVVTRSAAGLHDLCEGLVGGELQGGEGNGHGESGRVGGVECTDALGAEDCGCTFSNVAEGRAVDLHALLDHVEGVHEGVAGDCCAGSARCWCCGLVLSIGREVL